LTIIDSSSKSPKADVAPAAPKTAAAETKTQDASSEKSKADLKRERREKQEAQRAAKAAAASGVPVKTTAPAAKTKQPDASKPKTAPTTATPSQGSSGVKPTAKHEAAATTSTPSVATAESAGETTTTSVGKPAANPSDESFVSAPVTLKLNKKSNKENVALDELSSACKSKLFHHFEQYSRDYSVTEKFSLDNPSIHTAFIKFGLQTAHEKISGSNSRCLAFLNAFKKFVNDYKAPNSDKKTISEDLQSKLKQINK
jgi:hypothetical protein